MTIRQERWWHRNYCKSQKVHPRQVGCARAPQLGGEVGNCAAKAEPKRCKVQRGVGVQLLLPALLQEEQEAD